MSRSPSSTEKSGTTRDRHGALRPDVHGRAQRGDRLVDGHHPARDRYRERRRDREPGACARQRGPARARGSCRSAGTRACRAARRWGRTRRRSRAAVAVTPEGAAALSEEYGFKVPSRPGLTAEEMIEAALRGEVDVLYSSGGNFLEVLPSAERVESALQRVQLRVHQDIVMSSQMLVDGETVVLLPAATRYEQRDGGTETTTERRIAFSPEIGRPGRRGAQRVGDLRRRRPPRRSRARRSRGVRLRSGDPRRDRGASCRSTRGSRRCTAPATRCNGAAHASVRAACSRRRTARPASPRSSPPTHRSPRGTSG